MKTLRYKVLLRKEEDGTYTVIVPSLPGCLIFRRTAEEALETAKETIGGFIACMIERGEEVPVETDDSRIKRNHTWANESNLKGYLSVEVISWNMASKTDTTIKKPHLPNGDHTGLIRASQRTLAPLIEKEADIYSVVDLKVRFK